MALRRNYELDNISKTINKNPTSFYFERNPYLSRTDEKKGRVVSSLGSLFIVWDGGDSVIMLSTTYCMIPGMGWIGNVRYRNQIDDFGKIYVMSKKYYEDIKTNYLNVFRDHGDLVRVDRKIADDAIYYKKDEISQFGRHWMNYDDEMPHIHDMDSIRKIMLKIIEENL